MRKTDVDDLKQNENEASVDRPGHGHLIEKPERTASPEDGNSFIIHPVFPNDPNGGIPIIRVLQHSSWRKPVVMEIDERCKMLGIAVA